MINKEFFDFQICKGSMNSIQVNCGVITDNDEKGKEIMEYILSLFNKDEIESIIVQKSILREKIKLKNGSSIVWLYPRENVRGYRFMKGIIDKDIPKETLLNNVLPTLCYAKDEDIIYF